MMIERTVSQHAPDERGRDWQAIADRLAEDAAAGSPLLRLNDARISRATGVDSSTAIRWILVGKKGITLDGVRAGGRGWSTTTAAVARFLAHLTIATSRPPVLPMPLRERESGPVGRLGGVEPRGTRAAA